MVLFHAGYRTAGSLSDLAHVLIIGAPCQLGPQWGLLAMSLSVPSGSLHMSACASSQHGDWVSRKSTVSSKAGSCVDL